MENTRGTFFPLHVLYFSHHLSVYLAFLFGVCIPGSKNFLYRYLLCLINPGIQPWWLLYSGER